MMDRTFLEIGKEVAKKITRMTDAKIAELVCLEVSKAYNCGYRDAMEERNKIESGT